MFSICSTCPEVCASVSGMKRKNERQSAKPEIYSGKQRTRSPGCARVALDRPSPSPTVHPHRGGACTPHRRYSRHAARRSPASSVRSIAWRGHGTCYWNCCGNRWNRCIGVRCRRSGVSAPNIMVASTGGVRRSATRASAPRHAVRQQPQKQRNTPRRAPRPAPHAARSRAATTSSGIAPPPSTTP